jgi:hypothetical protein
LDECCIRCGETDEREGESAAFEAVQDAESARCWRKDQELNNAAEDAVHGEHGTDSTTFETETTAEFKGKTGVVFGGDLGWVVKEDGEELVVGYRVKREECVCY